MCVCVWRRHLNYLVISVLSDLKIPRKANKAKIEQNDNYSKTLVEFIAVKAKILEFAYPPDNYKRRLYGADK